MEKIKVVSKFGGSSVIKFPRIIKEIFNLSDEKERNFIVVSVPGKKNGAKNKNYKKTQIL